MIYYSVTNSGGRHFYAAVDWREPDDPEAERGRPQVWSTDNGDWQPDKVLDPADLAMPQYKLQEWDVDEVPEDQMPLELVKSLVLKSGN